jgi:predicted patatin/cPLA2 family phospholipase
MIDKYVKEQMGQTEKEADRYEEMSNEEREDLVNALKTKWDAVNTKYQRITHLVRLDTMGQLRRKEQMEAELKQLEYDIEKLTRNGPVLIS